MRLFDTMAARRCARIQCTRHAPNACSRARAADCRESIPTCVCTHLKISVRFAHDCRIGTRFFVDFENPEKKSRTLMLRVSSCNLRIHANDLANEEKHTQVMAVSCFCEFTVRAISIVKISLICVPRGNIRETARDLMSEVYVSSHHRSNAPFAAHSNIKAIFPALHWRTRLAMYTPHTHPSIPRRSLRGRAHMRFVYTHFRHDKLRDVISDQMMKKGITII
mmetsp:Transcript_66875/g.108440  ORF Transcript_66875/g.108440 Transcript_66875/m.108440 type:complete len:222 (+) Transcript_66875:980-1645(+)